MSKVTYIFGAGASFGERTPSPSNPNLKDISRGLPIVSELQAAIKSQIYLLEGRHAIEDFNELGINKDEAAFLKNTLQILADICASYPTIDTYAKQLFVTKRNDIRLTSTLNENSYNALKRLLSVAFLLLQEENKRDLRYDGFIASLINAKREFPPMTILSWNYDIQFEMAYSGYFTDYCSGLF